MAALESPVEASRAPAAAIVAPKGATSDLGVQLSSLSLQVGAICRGRARASLGGFLVFSVFFGEGV